MKYRLAYGKNGHTISLDEHIDVTLVEPKYLAGLTEPHKKVCDALRNPFNMSPLAEMAQQYDKIGIIFNDITRPTPNQLLISAILSELQEIDKSQIVLFNALGTHRFNSEAELRQMLGDDIFENYRIVQNNAFDQSTQIYKGTSSRGTEIWLNAELLKCDLIVATGFIEPHLFAGFSGGGKAIMPGMAGLKTILENHSAPMISDPNSVWGITYGNPIWEEIHEITQKTTPVFLLNVALNREKEITAVFAGNVKKTHAIGCDFVKSTAMVAVPHLFDIVITTNSGFPLDLNLYQSIKGVSAAAKIIKTDGTIIVVAECRDGIPDHGLYGKLLKSVKSPQELMELINSPGFNETDQWQAQIHAQIQLKTDVYVYSENLSEQQIKSALLKPCRNIEKKVSELIDKYGPNAKICILPEGPQTIPYLAIAE